MMKRIPGFTLIEMLLAAALSCILLYGLMRAFTSVAKYVDVLRESSTLQRTVGLTFYQLRTDLSAAFVPEVLNLDETKEEKEKRKKETDQLTPEKKEAAAKEHFKSFFLLSSDEQNDVVKVEGVRRHRFKQLSFVTTNPLHVYAQKQPCIVRVAYELQPNKKRSTREREVFSLVRKEAADITNAGVKEAQKDKDTTTVKVQQYVIADNLRGAYLECELFKRDIPQKKEDADKEIPEAECVQSTTWGNKENLQGFVPRTVTCWLDFWQGDGAKSVLVCEVIDIKSYPTQHPKPEDKKPDQPPSPADQQGAQATPADVQQPPAKPVQPQQAPMVGP
jgi:prepilin-type N-terminal cleavage/methylation domain-containing protein